MKLKARAIRASRSNSATVSGRRWSAMLMIEAATAMIVQPHTKKCNAVQRRRLDVSPGSINYAGASRKTKQTVLVNPMRKKPFSCALINFGVEGGGKPVAGNDAE